jgi:mannosyltransferase OCH1-like enzyme
MIPRTLHQIWIGPRPVPRRWTESWRRLHPEFEYRLWDEAAIDAFGLANLAVYRRYGEAEIYDGAADVARAEILHRFGGVYVDADSEALRPLGEAPIMNAGFFAQYEPNDSYPVSSRTRSWAPAPATPCWRDTSRRSRGSGLCARCGA